MLRLRRTAPRPTRERGGRRTGRTLALVVAFLVLAPAVANAAPIEDYATYQPQTNCSPNAKPGTLKLSRWLQRQYPGSGSLGISRSCKDGGVSEHKEGRAFDWAVNVGSARDRRYVASFLKRIFATDKAGNRHALARRMGIMYLIWNDHIYSSYRGFVARAYRPCKVLRTCGDTLRHRNHVHISLSRAGGAGRTSWYTGHVSVPPAPKPPTPSTPKPSTPTPTTPKPSTPKPSTPRPSGVDLSTTPYRAVTVPATGAVKQTSFTLAAGTTYQVTAAGLYGYGAPTDVADASCRWSASSHRWVPSPSTDVATTHGSLNLLVNDVRVSSTCEADHVYTTTVKPTRTAPLRLQVANTARGASGSLVVAVSKRGTDVSRALPTYPSTSSAPAVGPATSGNGLVGETVYVPASADSVQTAGAVERGASYRVTVSGSASLGGGVRTDGRCVGLSSGWWPQASLDRRTPDATHARLYVDGQPFGGRAVYGSSVCDARSHVDTVTATRDGRLELALWDPLSREDDTGALAVTVQRLTRITEPGAATAESPGSTTPWRQSRDYVRVDAGDQDGSTSTMRLRQGQTVLLAVSGTQRSNGREADASCVREGNTWRSTDSLVALDQDPLDLWVDGTRTSWRPYGDNDGSCSSDHTYWTRFTATRNGPVRFTVLDLDYRDNDGTLTVTMMRQ
ncbi:MAG: hypothetical protein HOQ22_03325 [Nocardioidaceae bacterium]|nr:hypothetical protein [Nocardioidaceae bacterium]NUS50058.1 hypothetical protein [Nocardioidaceae bacterium]